MSFLHKFRSKEIALFCLALVLAYGGGYYFGRHPNSLRELTNSKSLVIATTEDSIFTPEVQHWIEDRWGHSFLVVVVTEAELPSKIENTDLIVAPLTVLKPLSEKLRNSPADLPRDWIFADILKEDSKVVPLLWKLLPMDQSRWRLIELGMAWTPRSDPDSELIRWLLSAQAQLLMIKKSGFLSVRRDIVEDAGDDKKLRAIPLSQLSYE